MKHKSDKFLRQDLFFILAFRQLADQCISAKINSIQSLWESVFNDRETRNKDREAIKTQILIHKLARQYKLKTLNAKEIIDIWLYDLAFNYVLEFTLKNEVPQRLAKLAKTAHDDLNQIMIVNNQLKPDKLIMICLRMVEILNEDEIELPYFVENIFDVFLQIEHLHNIDRKVDEWHKIKRSADKQARRFVDDFKKLGYFKKKC